jgi:NTE family protein
MRAISFPLRHAVLSAVAAALTLATGSPAAAQSSVETRPRIGLALSGGGARGLAHVGVLKVLEELHIPVDCITGTSMGAVVGGAYAAGASAAQMDEVVRKVDWNDLFTDRPPREEMTPRRKQEDYSGYFAPEIGLRNGSLRLAKGVVAGVTIESFLRKLTASAAGVEEFSRLPIPFRAVAADIESGQQVVLSDGSLPLAMRASMAIPGAVNPVEIHGQLLVDGGIANNLPIELARQTCGDVVIAVNIGTPPMKRDEITSALSVVGQLVNFLGKEHVDQQIAAMTERDVLIKPELGNITAASFDRAADAIHIGEEAARAVAEQLRRYSLPAAQYAALRQHQLRAQDHSLGQFDAIEFEGLVLAQPATLQHVMDAKPGVPLDEDTLTNDLRRIYGRGDFDSIDYRIHEQDGKRTLIIHAQEKDTGPQSLRLGLSLSTSLGG